MLGEGKPEWLRAQLPNGKEYARVKLLVQKKGIGTVCEEAHCPNIAECWNSGTATFMVLGKVCTRGCRFCAVKTGLRGEEVNENEAAELAKAVKEMGLDYVVITSVDRDDLPDQGAGHFAECVREVKKENPATKIEILIPDFRGERELIEEITHCGAEVISHNIETVKELQGKVRDGRANYEQSLEVLRAVKEFNPLVFTKSSIMLGLGETKEQAIGAMRDLRKAKVDFLTLGQYLQPSKNQIEAKRFVEPREFEELRETALEMGFGYCASGPLVRSSYRAGEFFIKNAVNGMREEKK
ncbi:MAG: lipoyl synthase [archaeon]